MDYPVAQGSEEDQDAQVDPVIQEDPDDPERRESQEETADQGLEDQGDPVDHAADQARSTGTRRNHGINDMSAMNVYKF